MNEKHVLEWTPRAGIFAQSTQIWLLLDCTKDFAFQNTVIKWDFLVLGTVWRPLAAPRQPPPKNRRKSSQKTRRKPNLLVQKVCSEWNIKYWMHRQQKKSIDTCSQESLITNLHLNLQLVIDNFAEGMVSQTWSPHLTASISCRKAVRPLKLGVKDAPAVFILAKSTLHFLYPGFLSSQHTWIIFETVSCDQVKKPRAVFLLFLNWISLSTPLCFSWVCQLLVLYNCTHL